MTSPSRNSSCTSTRKSPPRKKDAAAATANNRGIHSAPLHHHQNNQPKERESLHAMSVQNIPPSRRIRNSDSKTQSADSELATTSTLSGFATNQQTRSTSSNPSSTNDEPSHMIRCQLLRVSPQMNVPRLPNLQSTTREQLSTIINRNTSSTSLLPGNSSDVRQAPPPHLPPRKTIDFTHLRVASAWTDSRWAVSSDKAATQS